MKGDGMILNEAPGYDVGAVLWAVVFVLFFLRRLQVRRGRPSKMHAGTRTSLHLLRPGALLGLLLSIPHPAGAHERRPLLPSRPKIIASDPPGAPASKDIPKTLLAGPGTSPPWEKTEIETFERAFTPSSNVDPWDEPANRLRRNQRKTPVSAHPAIHGQKHAGAGVTPLFPRISKKEDPQEASLTRDASRRKAISERAERLACMRRHPSGKSKASIGDKEDSCRHVVAPGDTLWDLAASHLETDDLRRIARFWPKIHRKNRDVIGANPNLLLPGQVLVIPAESE